MLEHEHKWIPVGIHHTQGIKLTPNSANGKPLGRLDGAVMFPLQEIELYCECGIWTRKKIKYMDFESGRIFEENV